MRRREPQVNKVPDGREILRRDRAMLELRRLLSDPKCLPARAAADGIRRRIAAFIKQKNDQKRRHARTIHRLLPIARDLVLAGLPRERHSPPPEFKRRCRRAVKGYDEDTWDLVLNLAGHLHNAARGQIADRKIRKKIDLRKVDPVDAYVHALSALWSAGRHTPEEVRESIDPRRVTDFTATPWFALGDLVLEAVRLPPDRQMREERWWDLGLLMLLVTDPSFDPGCVGLAELPPWETDEPGDHSFSQRSGVLDYVGGFTEPGGEVAEGGIDRVWLLTQRSKEHLAVAALRERPAPDRRRSRTSQSRRVPPPNDAARAPQGLSESDLGILLALEKRYPTRILKSNLEPERGPQTRTLIGRRIEDLQRRGLVDNKNTEGATLTDAGLAVLGAAKKAEAALKTAAKIAIKPGLGAARLRTD